MDVRFPGRMAGALAVAALLATACSPGGSGGSGGSGSGGAGSGSQPATASSASGSGTTLAAGTTLFPVTVGEKWVYASHLGSLGSYTTTNTVKAVKPASQGHLVTMTASSDIPGAAGKVTRLTYMFYNNGSIGVPYTQVSGAKVTIKSDSIVWPPFTDIQSGRPQHSTLRIAISVAGHAINEAVHVTVKGAGTHSVTVPAGHYQATVVDETLAEKVMGFPVHITIRTWLAPGVGPVKSEVLSKDAAVSTTNITEVLKSFSR
jgi:DUF3108-like